MVSRQIKGEKAAELGNVPTEALNFATTALEIAYLLGVLRLPPNQTNSTQYDHGVPVILKELVLPDGFDLVSPSFTVRDVTTELSEP
ncbi:unnamed protein product [Schistosoma margrebowiei]|uniref:Uncharacterized protein n=1 Tax=Schistosoma margrebowiei TaxID=48269 RepID=A0A183ME63_9TREM|nr:unnamed protein product [Schistosoma margrebowiei]